jgi:hypothetical protein
MKYLKIIILYALICFPVITQARETCDYEQQTRIQRIASNIATSYEYNEVFVEGEKFSTVTFDVILSNTHKDIYIVDEQTQQTYYNNTINEITIAKQKPGKYLKFAVYGNIDGCYETHLTTLYVTLPNFNKYYSDPLCRNVPDYALCNKWSKIDMSYKDFEARLNKHLQESTKKEEIIKISDLTLFEKIISFLATYSFIIFGSIIIICAGLIIYLNKKDDFDLSVK